MILVTTPTGQVGRQLVSRLLDRGLAVRVLARDIGRLDPAVREHTDAVEGSHDDPSTLEQALDGADALFWLVPPNPQAPSAEAHYLAFAKAGAEAIRRSGVGHVVGVTSAGHGWPAPAGLLSAAFAMDAELEATGAAYRGLSMPFYMENLLDQRDAIREQGAFYLTFAPSRPLALIATRDIAESAAALLADLEWSGQEHVPTFGPDRLSPDGMAEVLSDVVGQPVAYRQTTLETVATGIAEQGGSEQAIRDVTEMLAAQDEGIYDDDWATAEPTPTDFRTWSAEVLHRGVHHP